jgi:hypothetical protein
VLFPLLADAVRVDVRVAQYQTEANDYAGRSLKDDGTGVRPLVK